MVVGGNTKIVLKKKSILVLLFLLFSKIKYIKLVVFLLNTLCVFVYSWDSIRRETASQFFLLIKQQRQKVS